MSVAGYPDDRGVLAAAHVFALREMLHLPELHTQRVVERVSFLPSGGERWQRDVQITLPPARASDRPLTHFVVSLGLFRRFRYPEFTVHDGNGHRLPLVTRRQHWHCVALATLAKYVTDDQWQRMDSDPTARSQAADKSEAVYAALGDLITDIARDREHDIEEIEALAREFFATIGVDDPEGAASGLADDCHELATFTHYLCWVPAKWEDTVSLTATYTMSDTVRLAGRPRKDLPGAVQEPEPQSDERGLLERASTWIYGRLGLCPVWYEFRTPSRDHTGSYYFSVEPPKDAHVVLLDWGTDRCFGATAGEVDSAFPTCHVHNEDADGAPSDDAEPGKRRRNDWRISAFLKADPVDNGALLALAVFNIALALLAQNGSFVPRVAGQQQWMLLAPVALVALIAQHRARYYSGVTRPLRGVMWLYLFATIVFGASVAFDVSGARSDPDLWILSVNDDLTSAAMACASLGLMAMVALSGSVFDGVTARWYRYRLSKAADSDANGVSYLTVARRYGHLALVATALVVAIAGTLMVELDWASKRQAKVERIEVEAEREREAERRGRRGG